jgi:hypothetical protein
VPSGLRLSGLPQMTGNLRRFIQQFPRKTAQAVKEEFGIEKKESQRRTPFQTGRLRNSHEVLEPTIIANRIRCEIVVTAPYAIPVHENLTSFHRVGQAKFLESTLYESRRYIGARIARRIDVSTSKF